MRPGISALRRTQLRERLDHFSDDAGCVASDRSQFRCRSHSFLQDLSGDVQGRFPAWTNYQLKRKVSQTIRSVLPAKKIYGGRF